MLHGIVRTQGDIGRDTCDRSLRVVAVVAVAAAAAAILVVIATVVRGGGCGRGIFVVAFVAVRRAGHDRMVSLRIFRLGLADVLFFFVIIVAILLLLTMEGGFFVSYDVLILSDGCHCAKAIVVIQRAFFFNMMVNSKDCIAGKLR